MTMTLHTGPRIMGCARDSEGHREYTVTWLVRSDTGLDGPANALRTPGLPVVGSPWLIDSDTDLWAWCRPDAEVKTHGVPEGRPAYFWTVTQKFSTKPLTKCSEEQVEDPLLQPQKVSGSSIRYTEEGAFDRFWRPIVSSSWEWLRGPQNEWDANRSQIIVEQNVPLLELALCEGLRDTVNAFPLWGLSKRCIKLSDFNWSEEWYGTCNRYYKRTFTFDLNPLTFDRRLLDEGTKALNGHNLNGTWTLDDINGSPPNRFNPMHFIRYKDVNGENVRCILNGAGEPITTGDPGKYHALTVTVAGAGTGYVVGGWVELAGGTGTTKAVLDVLSVGSNGAILTVRIVDPGSYTATPSDPVAQDSSYQGTGATFTLTWDQDPGTPGTGPGYRFVQKYAEGNFLLLGIPALLGP